MIEIITSFDKRYYDLIGKDCVNSWLKHWNPYYKLTCYVEDFSFSKNYRIRQIQFDQLDQDYYALQQEDFHRSIKRFSKKAYSFIHAMNNTDKQWILWIDADVITESNMPWDFWNKILNPSHLSLYLGVSYTEDKQGNPGSWLVPETGVFAVNTHHPKFKLFKSEYIRRYKKRDYKDLRRFYDNDVFGAAIKLSKANCTDLCADFAKPYKTPMRHTVLGPYLTHHKAKHSKEHYSQTGTDDDQ